MPILPNAARLSSAPTTAEGGSPRGWTFLSTAVDCWHAWSLKYIFGLMPLAGEAPLLIGSAYHALLEGIPRDEVTKMYPEHTEEAVRYFKDRIEHGPPLSDGAIIEKTYVLFGGLMTSKPDRVEDAGSGHTRIRDYKTSGTFSEHDEAKWNIDGGILGEVLAGKLYEKGLDEGLVDIQRKWADENGKERSGNNTKIVKVTLTQKKVDALESLVRQVWTDLDCRLVTLSREAAPKDAVTARERLLEAFPRNTHHCVGKYGPCRYYARCWGDGKPEQFLFKHVNPARRWVGAGGPKKDGFKNEEPKEDSKSRAASVETIYTRFKKAT